MEKRNGTLQSDVRTDIGIIASVTLFMPITRAWRVAEIAKMLNTLDQTGYKVEAVFCIDTTEITDHYVRNAMEKHELVMPYTILHTGRPPVTEVRMSARRDRIRDMLKFAVPQLPDNDYVFMVEDDTEIKPSAMRDLISDHAHLETAGIKVGFVEGVQVGRHGFRMIGAWRWDDLNDPQVIETVPYEKHQIYSKIDGGGLYCFVTRTALLKAHDWAWYSEPQGIDAMYGVELRRQGYQNFISWPVRTGHMQREEKTLYPDDSVVVCRYEKQPEGHWLLMNGRKGYIS